MGEYIVGIDIGSSKISAAAGKLDKSGNLQIIGAASERCSGVKKGIIVDIDNTSESIKKCLRQIESMLDCQIKEAYISFPGVISELVLSKGVVAISSEDREIRGNDVNRVMRSAKIMTIPANMEIVGVIPNQYIVDGTESIQDPIGMSGIRLELDAQLVTAQSTLVSNLMKSLNNAGLTIKGIVFQPIAESKAALKKEEMVMGTALVNIGAETSNVSIFKGGNIVYNDHVNLGGSIITNDIALCLKTSNTQAENLKLKYGIKGHDINNNPTVQLKADFNNEITIDLNVLKQIIEARIEEILMLINRKIRNSGKYNEISGIVIVGGGISLFEGIEEYGKKILEMPFRIAKLNYPGATSPVYASAVGTVMDVAESLKVKASTISSDCIKSKSAQKRIFSTKGNEEDDIFDDHEDKEGKGLMSRIKDFFTEFF
ncbi:MAG: cell division protein FtsA [Clostridiaceae bacterium]